ncbi:hypothetical protein ACSSS7_000108 [Eimeria intestinalis]
MGKNRGFKPKGLQLNPIKRVASGGPSLAEKLGRDSRPTWDQLHKMLKKKEASNSEFLEKYENECFSRELQCHLLCLDLTRVLGPPSLPVHTAFVYGEAA